MTEYDYFLPWTATSNRIVDRDGDLVAKISLEVLEGWKAEVTASYVADVASNHQQLQAENAKLKQRINQLETPPNADHVMRATLIVESVIDGQTHFALFPLVNTIIRRVAESFAADARHVAELEAAVKDNEQTRDLLRKATAEVEALRGVIAAIQSAK